MDDREIDNQVESTSDSNSLNDTNLSKTVRCLRGCWHLLSWVCSIMSYTVECFTIASVAYVYYNRDQYELFGLTLGFFLLPTMILMAVSVVWYYDLDRYYNRQRELHPNNPAASEYKKRFTTVIVMMHILLIGVIYRYGELIYLVLVGRTANVRFLVRDTTLLRFMHSFLVTAPQIVIQLSVVTIATNPDNESTSLSGATVIALTAAIISLSYTLLAFTTSDRLSGSSRRVILPAHIVQTLWYVSLVVSRILALALFAHAYGFYVFIVVGVHWVAVVIGLLHQGTTICADVTTQPKKPRLCLEILFDVVAGFVYVFVFFNLKEGKTRYWRLAFHLLVFVENLIMILLFYVNQPDLRYTPAALAVVIGLYILGLMLMMLFYVILHPKKTKNWYWIGIPRDCSCGEREWRPKSENQTVEISAPTLVSMNGEVPSLSRSGTWTGTQGGTWTGTQSGMWTRTRGGTWSGPQTGMQSGTRMLNVGSELQNTLQTQTPGDVELRPVRNEYMDSETGQSAGRGPPIATTGPTTVSPIATTQPNAASDGSPSPLPTPVGSLSSFDALFPETHSSSNMEPRQTDHSHYDTLPVSLSPDLSRAEAERSQERSQESTMFSVKRSVSRSPASSRRAATPHTPATPKSFGSTSPSPPQHKELGFPYFFRDIPAKQQNYLSQQTSLEQHYFPESSSAARGQRYIVHPTPANQTAQQRPRGQVYPHRSQPYPPSPPQRSRNPPPRSHGPSSSPQQARRSPTHHQRYHYSPERRSQNVNRSDSNRSQPLPHGSGPHQSSERRGFDGQARTQSMHAFSPAYSPDRKRKVASLEQGASLFSPTYSPDRKRKVASLEQGASLFSPKHPDRSRYDKWTQDVNTFDPSQDQTKSTHVKSSSPENYSRESTSAYEKSTYPYSVNLDSRHEESGPQFPSPERQLGKPPNGPTSPQSRDDQSSEQRNTTEDDHFEPRPRALSEGAEFAGVTKRLPKVPPKPPLGHRQSYHSPPMAARNPRLRGNYANWSPERPIQNRWKDVNMPTHMPQGPRRSTNGSSNLGRSYTLQDHHRHNPLQDSTRPAPRAPQGNFKQSHNPPREGNYVRANPLLRVPSSRAPVTQV